MMATATISRTLANHFDPKCLNIHNNHLPKEAKDETGGLRKLDRGVLVDARQNVMYERHEPEDRNK